MEYQLAQEKTDKETYSRYGDLAVIYIVKICHYKNHYIPYKVSVMKIFQNIVKLFVHFDH